MNHRRDQLYGLLGDLPPRQRPITVKLKSRDETATSTIEHLLLDLNGQECVPAIFMRPKGITGRIPVVLYNHAHGGTYPMGKQEVLVGRPGCMPRPYGEDFIQRGWAVLAIDHWLFGERSGRSELNLFKETLWRGQVLWGMMVYDSLRAVDYLYSRPDVDSTRIATLGLSMGSTMAWWLAALDERIAACVDICCLTDYQAIIDDNGLDGHGIYYYVPGLLKAFTSSEINALIIPRPHLALAGLRDTLTPVGGLDRIDAEMKRLYATAGCPDRWQLIREDVGHEDTPSMHAAALAFLGRWLV